MHTTTKRIAAALFLAASAASLATPAMADELTAPAPAGNASDVDPGLDPGTILKTGTITSQGSPVEFLG